MSLGSSQPTRTQQAAVVLITLLAVIGLAVAPGMAVAQDTGDDDDPPPLPAAYFGDVTVDGDPADGVTITAEIDGDQRGSIVAEDGEYGGPGTLEEKLTVDGEDGEEGAEITFFVNGVEADTVIDGDETDVTYEPGVNQELDLEVDALEGPFFGVTIDEIDESVTAGEEITGTAVIDNTGDEEDTQDITVVADGEDVSTETVTLDGGDSETVDIEIPTDDDDVGSIEVVVESEDDDDSATVSVGPADEPFYDVTIESVEADGVDVTDSATPAQEGDTITVEAIVENTGAADGDEQAIDFLVDGDAEDSEGVTLTEDATETVEFEYETQAGDAPGVFLEVESEDDADSANAFIGTEAAFEIDEFTVPDPVTQNAAFDAEVVVENTGDLDGDVEVTVSFDDGSVVETETSAEIDPGETDTVSISVTPPQEPLAGGHDVDVEAELPDDADSVTTTVDYEAIQSGVEAADAGDEVRVASPVDGETFTDDVDVDTEDVLVRGTERGLTLAADSVELSADDAGIRRLAIEGDGSTTAVLASGDGATIVNSDLSDADVGVTVEGADAEIRRNTMEDLDTHAVVVEDAADAANLRANRITVDGMTSAIEVDSADTLIVANRLLAEDAAADLGVDLADEDGGTQIIANTIAITPNEPAPEAEVDLQADPAAIQIGGGSFQPGDAATVPQVQFNNLDGLTGDRSSPVDLRVDNLEGGAGVYVLFGNYQAPEGSLNIDLAVFGSPASLESDAVQPLGTVDGGVERQAIDSGVLQANGPEEPEEEETEDEPLDEPDYQINDFEVDPDDELEVGESIEVTATIENEGDQQGDQTVEFEVNGELEGEDDLELDGGESEDVAFTYETQSGDLGDLTVNLVTDDAQESATVEVTQPPEFEVDDFDVDPEEIEAGDEIDASAEVENVGGDGEQTVELRIGSDTGVGATAGDDYGIIASQTVDLDAGESTTVEFDDESVSTSVSGVSVLGPNEIGVTSVDDGDSFSPFIVNEPDVTFDVEIDTDATDTSVTAGDTVTVVGEIENIDDQTDTQTVRGLIDGSEQEREDDVELDPAETFEFEFTYDTDEDDIDEVIGEIRTNTASDSVTIDVEEEPDPTPATGGGGAPTEDPEETPTPEPDTPTPEPDTPTPEPDTPTPEPDTPTPEPDTPTPEEVDDDTPGFGVVVALIALLAAALLAVRRR